MKKSKRYVGVYYRKRKDGDVAYYFVYKNEDNKPTYHKVGLKSQKITEKYVFEKRSEFILQLRNGDIPDLLKKHKKNEIKFSEMADYYFGNHITRSSERRRKLYEYKLKPIFGDRNVFHINEKDITKFRNKYAKQNAPHTVNLYIELMSTIYNYYNKFNSTSIENPTLKVDKLKVNNIRKRILTKEEIDFIFKELETHFMLSLFCSLCLCTGARKSTVLNYKIKDINLAHRTINSFDFKNQTSYVSFIDDRTFNLLELRLNSSYNIKPNSPLVYMDTIKDLSRWMNRQLKPVFDILNDGLELDDTQNRVVIHTFRHTLLSHLGMKGVSSQILQKISNHKDSSMVDRYVKLNNETGRDEIIDIWKD